MRHHPTYMAIGDKKLLFIYAYATRNFFQCVQSLIFTEIRDGGRRRTRTYDPLIKSQLLYQLS